MTETASLEEVECRSNCGHRENWKCDTETAKGKKACPSRNRTLQPLTVNLRRDRKEIESELTENVERRCQAAH